MDIERATMGDVPTLVERWIALAEDQRQHGSHLLGRANEAAIRETLGRRVVEDHAFLARRNDDVVGFATVTREDDRYQRDVARGIVENIYVDPNHRDEGVGSALLDRAESALLAEGVETILLEVMAENEAARRLYADRGYRPHRLELEHRPGSDTH